MKTQKFEVVAAESNIDWVGKKVTGAHNGTINVKEGEVSLNNGEIESGKFIIDTTSIKILDVIDPETNSQFWGHLASDDFFSLEKYPEASLNIASVSGKHVKGDLTIKGITHPVDFEINLELNGEVLTATGKLIIDRTKYGMKFRSANFFENLGDLMIFNDFELNVSLTAKAA